MLNTYYDPPNDEPSVPYRLVVVRVGHVGMLARLRGRRAGLQCAFLAEAIWNKQLRQAKRHMACLPSSDDIPW